MTTLSLRALHVPAIPGLARLAAAIDTMFEIFADVHEMTLAAQKRFPFAGL